MIHDKVIKASALCTVLLLRSTGDSTHPTYAADCTTYGIK